MFEAINKVYLMTDLDGTLLTSEKKISNADLEAIERFRKNGGRFAFATGRTLQSAMQYIEELKIDSPVIMYNGACIYDPVSEKILYSHALQHDAYDFTMEIFDAFPEVGAEILTPDGTYIIKCNSYEKEHAAYCSDPIYCTIDDVPKGQWLKVLFAMSPSDIERLKEYTEKRHFEGVTFIRSENIFYEMLPYGISKGSALNECRRLEKNENITFAAAGDYNNDLELIINADFGAAPANAIDCVKDAADYIMKASCDEGAISELISVIESKVKKMEVL